MIKRKEEGVCTKRVIVCYL